MILTVFCCSQSCKDTSRKKFILGRKSRIGHRKYNILLNEKKVTSFDLFQHSSYCVHSKCIKVYICVKLIRGRVNNSLQPSLFSSHGCIYTKVAVSTSSMNLCLSCHVTWTVLHAWLHYGISIKTMHFGHC